MIPQECAAASQALQQAAMNVLMKPASIRPLGSRLMPLPRARWTLLNLIACRRACKLHRQNKHTGGGPVTLVHAHYWVYFFTSPSRWNDCQAWIDFTPLHDLTSCVCKH